MADVQPKKLAIIDGKSVFYRGYYAMGNLATKDGTPTGGVFGFATMALEVIRRLQPDYVAVAWDKPKTNIRKRLEIYPEYKAGRKPAPPDFYEQIPVLHELLEAFGWPLYEMDDYEADDLMGTLAKQASESGIETLLITSDLDALQVVGPLTKVYALKKGLSNIELYSPKSFTAKYGIEVDQFLDLKALKGDSSDNIPGVPGIGEKTAVQLLKEYKTIDGIYDNLVLIKDSVRKKLEAGKESAYMSKKLGAIWCDAPLKLDLDRLNSKAGANAPRIVEILEKLEFKSLARQIPDVLGVQLHHSTEVTSQFQDYSRMKHKVVATEQALIELVANLFPDNPQQQVECTLHSRSAGVAGRNPRYLVVSSNSEQVYTLDLQELASEQVCDLLLNRLEKVPVSGYDLKATFKVLIELGCTQLPDVGHDVLITSFAINSLRRDLSLTELAGDVGYSGSALEDIDDETFLTKVPEIIGSIQSLVVQQRQELETTKTIQKLVTTIDFPVIPILAAMEHRGIQLDTAYLESFAEEISDSISDIEQQIYGHADQEFNIASPSQLADILFEKLGLPKQGIKKGKTGYSTAASELDKLRLLHPIIDLISQFREVTKLKNTYVDTLPKLVDGHSRVHTTFHLTIAQTGRLSSTDPNLQNIPVRTELGRRIRTAFVAGKGNVLVSADYSQFELRLAAAMSGDQDMIAMFNRGADIHLTTAAQVYGRAPEDVTKQMRSAAKTINFGVLYGMSPHGLAAATGMTFAAAKSFIDEYFRLRAPLLGYLESLKEKARTDGYVETLFGRRRPMPDIRSSNYIIRSSAERAAMNMPIQGTEADLMKMAMVAVQDAFRRESSWRSLSAPEQPQQLLQIHDSILVECREAQAETVAKLLRQTMENIYTELPVKLAVDTSTGSNWGEL